MSKKNTDVINLKKHRFSRFESIQWWNQDLLSNAKVLVVGAGALGNEVIKNCALLGIGNVVVVDMDRIEESNLSRSILFRIQDTNRFKSECAAESMESIYPDIHAIPIIGNVLCDIGVGFFHWADVVVGAVDNREARVYINKICASLGKPWIDGGIEVMNGIVRGFHPPKTACYECTMGETDWQQLDKRRSCSLIARMAVAQGGVATTPTIASIIGGIQVQEVVKFLHGIEPLAGKGYFFEGQYHTSYPITYGKKNDCYHHMEPDEIFQATHLSSESNLMSVWTFAESILGDCIALDFEHEIVSNVYCQNCDIYYPVFQPSETIQKSKLLCEKCNYECNPSFLHSISESNKELLDKNISEIGLPLFDILWARNAEKSIAIEITGDLPIVFKHKN